MILQELYDKKLIHPPHFLLSNTQYLTITGSTAYGVADTSNGLSDFDIYGLAIPSKNILFPHLAGHIEGFGTPPPSFQQWEQHRVFDQTALGGKGRKYDFNIFSIVKMFELCRQGNPNMIDSLFTPENCIIHITQIGRLIRDNRNMFVSKLIWNTFRGYAFSSLHKATEKHYVKVGEFEREHGIEKNTKIEDVKQEMTRRGLSIVGL